MNKFVRKIMAIILPFIVVIISGITINPYKFPLPNSKESSIGISSEEKTKNQRLVKAIKALKNKSEIVFVGDSRTDILFSFENSDTLYNVSNFAFGGASFNEIMMMSWHILKHNDSIKSLVMGLNFNHFGVKNYSPLMEETLNLIDSPIRFFTSKHQIKGIINYVICYLFPTVEGKTKTLTHRRFTDKESFWNYQINSSARNFYENMKENKSFFHELDSLIIFCHDKEIEVSFFSPANHTDLQNQIGVWGLNTMESNFKEGMRRLDAPYLNFDCHNSFTDNRDNFNDPFHIKEKRILFLKILLTTHRYKPLTKSNSLNAKNILCE